VSVRVSLRIWFGCRVRVRVRVGVPGTDRKPSRLTGRNNRSILSR